MFATAYRTVLLLSYVQYRGSVLCTLSLSPPSRTRIVHTNHYNRTRGEMSTSSGTSSASDDDGHLPRGLPKRRRGWEGEDMELLRDDAPTAVSHAAVDLQQFRNTEVGKGYQAKHVVRQRTGMDSRDAVKVQDMTTCSASRSKSKEEHSRKSSKKSKKRKKHKHSSSPSPIDQDDRKREKSVPENLNDERLQRYLNCDGLRQFRRELESIVRNS